MTAPGSNAASRRRFLIVYGTKYGQTARIASRMADTLMSDGCDVTLVHTHDKSLPGTHVFSEYDGIIVGASVIRGKHQRAVTRFVRSNLASLSAMPAAFFSVSAAAGGTTPADGAKARRFVTEFISRTGWQPAMTTVIGGAMAYTKYNPLLRWMTRRASAREGRPTDTSRDHEFTDWAQVERFARTFAATLSSIR